MSDETDPVTESGDARNRESSLPNVRTSVNANASGEMGQEPVQAFSEGVGNFSDNYQSMRPPPSEGEEPLFPPFEGGAREGAVVSFSNKQNATSYGPLNSQSMPARMSVARVVASEHIHSSGRQSVQATMSRAEKPASESGLTSASEHRVARSQAPQPEAPAVQFLPNPISAKLPVHVQTTTIQAADDDPTWRRLQLILRKHREKEAAEQVDASEGPLVESADSDHEQVITHAQSGLSQKDAAIPSETPKYAQSPSGLVHRQQDETAVGATNKAEFYASTNNSGAEPKSPSGTTASSTVGQDSQRDSGAANRNRIGTNEIAENLRPVSANVVNMGPPLSDASNNVLRRAEGRPKVDAKSQLPSSEKVAGQLSTRAISESITPNEERPAPNALHVQSFGADAANAAPHALPLQQVWPVQRTADTTAPAVAHGADSIRHNERPEDAPAALLQPAERAALQQRLQDIPASRASESRIDIITPRRPRPVPRGADSNVSHAVVEPNGQNDAIRGRDDELPPVEHFHTSADTRDDVPLNAQIQTEIGPLPTDLWHLIGERPPLAASGMHRDSQQAGALTVQTDVQRAALTDSGGSDSHFTAAAHSRGESLPEGIADQSQALATRVGNPTLFRPHGQNINRTPEAGNTFVQRVESARYAGPESQNSDTEPNAKSVPSVSTDAVGTGIQRVDDAMLGQQESAAQDEQIGMHDSGTANINTDDLAQQVFLQIKRRLLIEHARRR
ncbi:MAG: hypothetical protein R3A44_10050 [Caldilineaceae bacterium]